MSTIMTMEFKTTQEKLEFFTQELTNIAREFKVIIDVGCDTSNNIHFYFKNGFGKFLTLKDLLSRRTKYKELISRLELLFTNTGLILDSSDFNDGCVTVARNHKTRNIVAYIDYEPYDPEEQQLTTYTFIKKC